jgi:hypothetical protein
MDTRTPQTQRVPTSNGEGLVEKKRLAGLPIRKSPEMLGQAGVGVEVKNSHSLTRRPANAF